MACPSSIDNITNHEMISNNITNSSEYLHLQKASYFIGRYYIWILFAFGFPGNLLSLIIIVKMSRHRLNTPLFYVALLAVVDNVAIILKLIENQIRSNEISMNAPACKILFFLGLTVAACPNWILIVMSAERFTAVRFPMKVGLIWSLKRAVIIISLALLFLCLVHVHILLSATSNDGKCCFHPRFHSFYHPLWFFISSFLYAIIPATLLTVLNILIITFLRKNAYQRQNMLSEAGQAVADSHKQERQVTIMLVTVAVVFILLTIPRCVFVCVWYYWKTDTQEYVKIDFVDTLTVAIADFNHAVNFYLYFVSAERFRKYFIEMMSSILQCVKGRFLKMFNGNRQSVELTAPE